VKSRRRRATVRRIFSARATVLRNESPDSFAGWEGRAAVRQYWTGSDFIGASRQSQETGGVSILKAALTA
jgi:hypothetical protein